MTFQLAKLAQNAGDSVMYDPGFRTVIETHLPIFRNPVVSRQMDIGADKIHQYEADFYGLLCELNIPMEHHWIYMRVNGMDSPTEFGTEAHDPYSKSLNFTLILPAADLISQLRTLYISTQR